MNTNKYNLGYNFINKKFLFAVFFFGAFATLLYLFIMLFKPFLDGILLALILAIVFYPMHKMIARKVKQRGLASSLSVICVMTTVIVPAAFLVFMLVNESTQIVSSKMNYKIDRNFLSHLEEKPLPHSVEVFKEKAVAIAERFDIDIKQPVIKAVQSAGKWTASMGAAIAKNSMQILLNIFALVVALFMFFKNGPRIVKEISNIIPMPQKYKEMLLVRLYETASGVIKAIILTAFTQGMLALVAFLIVGAPVPVLLCALTMICALIPIGGTALIWVPLVVYLVLHDKIPQAVFLGIWGTFVISGVDNILRPLFMGKSTKLPLSILFMALIGGLFTYGFRGLILGPIIGVCVFVFIQIYNMESSMSDKADSQDKEPATSKK